MGQQAAPGGAGRPGAARGTGGPGAPAGRIWLRWLLVGVLAFFAVFLAYLLLVAFLPRWWAMTIGDVVRQRFTTGTWLGLTLGFVFTLLPLVVLWLAIRRATTWQARGLLGLLALGLAVPNLLTLTVVLGGGSAAHAGERIMDVEAPAFRGASLAGALIAVVVFTLTELLLGSRRRTRRKLAELRAQVGDEE
ncbi:hypothetical protein GCM10012275_42320 [Longimycelium tulufanense]|uniref:Permease n=1 Tax=Longimycelium tulufanense TaxID=907463 RepID=A0A8J3CAY0_9PSEU|nr:hypothetical protein [Longimycelium tulufanense]GGM67297.1 hypothetical protein GCM10012275_42320 [Longimycelium tulufanense]